MENETFDSVLAYKSAMAQAHVMLQKGLLTTAEISIIETKMCEMFGINFDSLYRDIDWIKTPFRGNMVTEKEVL